MILVNILSYAVHLIVAIAFFVLLPLPILIKAGENEGKQSLTKILRIYKTVLAIAHSALIVSVVTGLILRFEMSLWVVVVILIWLAIGAYLGLTTKYVRLTLESLLNNKNYEEEVKKARLFSLFLTAAIAAMFIMKYAAYFNQGG